MFRPILVSNQPLGHEALSYYALRRGLVGKKQEKIPPGKITSWLKKDRRDQYLPQRYPLQALVDRASNEAP